MDKIMFTVALIMGTAAAAFGLAFAGSGDAVGSAIAASPVLFCFVPAASTVKQKRAIA
jgi:hypothetical protein